MLCVGDVEQRGPHVVNGLHNFIVRKLAKEIARKLGNAIAMPVMSFTPNNASPDLPALSACPMSYVAWCWSASPSRPYRPKRWNHLSGTFRQRQRDFPVDRAIRVLSVGLDYSSRFLL
jgi:hypothetical protein